MDSFFKWDVFYQQGQPFPDTQASFPSQLPLPLLAYIHMSVPKLVIGKEKRFILSEAESHLGRGVGTVDAWDVPSCPSGFRTPEPLHPTFSRPL